MISPEHVSVFYGILSSIIASAICYGALRQKVDSLFSDKDKYVRSDVFDATLQPIRDDLATLTSDVKEVLKKLGNRSCNKCLNYREE